MKKQRVIWIVFVAVTLLSAQEALKEQGQEPFPSPHDSLKMALTVRASQQSYRMDDKVPLEVQLTNTGAGTLFLFDDVCWNPGNFLTMHVFTFDSQVRRSHIIQSACERIEQCANFSRMVHFYEVLKSCLMN